MVTYSANYSPSFQKRSPFAVHNRRSNMAHLDFNNIVGDPFALITISTSMVANPLVFALLCLFQLLILPLALSFVGIMNITNKSWIRNANYSLLLENLDRMAIIFRYVCYFRYPGRFPQLRMVGCWLYAMCYYRNFLGPGVANKPCVWCRGMLPQTCLS